MYGTILSSTVHASESAVQSDSSPRLVARERVQCALGECSATLHLRTAVAVIAILDMA